MMNIPLLKSEDIECRVQSVFAYDKKVNAILLLYKNARIDMAILDNVFGPNGWQRTHEVINGNLFCTVEIWDHEKKAWIKKQDVGVESYTEKEKGQASDAFKRACVNVGIGRELYTPIFIMVNLHENEYEQKDGKYKAKASAKFHLLDVQYNDRREIISLKIADKNGNERFSYPASHKAEVATEKPKKADPPKPAEEKTPEYKCDKCESPFIDQSYNGKIYTAEYLYNNSRLLSAEIPEADGKVLCKKCRTALNNVST